MRTDRFPFDHYLASDALGLVVCAIPKCACTTLKHWLVATTEGAPVPPDHAGGIHRYCTARYALASRPPAEAQAVLDRAFRVAILRDPLERIASAYASKFVRIAPPERSSRPVVEAVQIGSPTDVFHDRLGPIHFGLRSEIGPLCSRVDYNRGITFREFLDYLVRTPDDDLDPHWRPQAAFVRPVTFHILGSIDHIDRVLQKALEHLGIERPVPAARTPHARKPARSRTLADTPAGELRLRSINPTADDLYTPELRLLVRARYQHDVELFNAAVEYT
ncbi:MAG: sulfotransferase family 2 domain-containing protein [Phycisphaeraceae bacterium]|nr:sulfotransferase family 2 domain-containing protein [Phycisphaeraceae bacterium]MCW5755173.1 sulfotransferase family 2 domain-containing protein [Phycisphaeraceae bacterium]